jgi:8-amino-7-oxononanoate synthase
MGAARDRWIDRLGAGLGELEAQGLARALRPGAGRDFASNDYLGLASDPAFARRVAARISAVVERGGALFAPSSRLLRGETELHHATEERLAKLKGDDAALLYPSGWQANAGALATLLGPQDRALSDAANHASLIDGLRLARCERVVVSHLDLEAYARELARPWRRGQTWVVVESLYSMDGDLAPLAELLELCERHGALLYVDDAHATGVYGRHGAGWLAEQGVAGRAAVTVTTFGKSLALQGACVSGPRELIATLVHASRAFLFTTALAPLLVVALGESLDVLEREPERRARVRANAERLRARLAQLEFDVQPGDSPIVPIRLGKNERALAAAAALAARGLDVRAVRPPAVPEDGALLRVSVHADHAPDELDRLAQALAECAR